VVYYCAEHGIRGSRRSDQDPAKTCREPVAPTTCEPLLAPVLPPPRGAHQLPRREHPACIARSHDSPACAQSTPHCETGAQAGAADCSAPGLFAVSLTRLSNPDVHAAAQSRSPLDRCRNNNKWNHRLPAPPISPPSWARGEPAPSARGANTSRSPLDYIVLRSGVWAGIVPRREWARGEHLSDYPRYLADRTGTCSVICPS